MTFRTCSYTKDVQDALKNGHWPAGCMPELRDHVRRCHACNDLVLVTQAFQLARQHSASDADVPAGLLWWRAQLRRRRVAAEQVSAPMTIAQIFAWAISLVAAVGLVVSQYHHGLQWASWWPEMPSRIFSFSQIANLNFDWSRVVLIPTLGALALVAGVVVYLVSEKS